MTIIHVTDVKFQNILLVKNNRLQYVALELPNDCVYNKTIPDEKADLMRSPHQQ